MIPNTTIPPKSWGITYLSRDYRHEWRKKTQRYKVNNMKGNKR